MELVIITPERELFRGAVKSVKVPGTSGQFEVLAGHAPIVSSLEKGVVRVIDNAAERHMFEIQSGFIEVLKDEVSVLCLENGSLTEN